LTKQRDKNICFWARILVDLGLIKQEVEPQPPEGNGDLGVKGPIFTISFLKIMHFKTFYVLILVVVLNVFNYLLRVFVLDYWCTKNLCPGELPLYINV